MRLFALKASLVEIFKRAGIGAILILGLACLMPGSIFAQDTCPADFEVQFNPDDNFGPFDIGEPVPIKIVLSIGDTEEPTAVEISHFAYKLDCAPGQTYPACTPQGNTVVLDQDSVTTTCENKEGVTPAPLVTLFDDVVTVDFDVETAVDSGVPSAISLDSTDTEGEVNSCEVTFNVMVTDLAPQNADREIVEVSGWGESDAVCTNQEPSSGATGSVSFMIKNDFSVFWVTKDFSDNNKAPVKVNFFCDTGTYTDKDFEITDPDTGGFFSTKGFIVSQIPSTGANCRIWEDPVPAGYTESYFASAREGATYEPPPVDNDPEMSGCLFNGVKGGEFDCAIVNVADPATFTVNKDWIVENSPGVEVREKADVTIYCDAPIVKKGKEKASPGNSFIVPQVNGGGQYTLYGRLGDGESLVGLVDTTFGPAKCSAKEQISRSGVETVEDCSKERTLKAGGSAECTFVNSVFFEAIPTLSAYGKALMVLLMLGLGVIGFRRLS